MTETRLRTFGGRAGQRVPKEQLGTWESHCGDGSSCKVGAEDNNANYCRKWKSGGLIVAKKGLRSFFVFYGSRPHPSLAEALRDFCGSLSDPLQVTTTRR